MAGEVGVTRFLLGMLAGFFAGTRFGRDFANAEEIGEVAAELQTVAEEMDGRLTLEIRQKPFDNYGTKEIDISKKPAGKWERLHIGGYECVTFMRLPLQEDWEVAFNQGEKRGDPIKGTWIDKGDSFNTHDIQEIYLKVDTVPSSVDNLVLMLQGYS